MPELDLTIQRRTGPERRRIAIDHLTIAGWTGRDARARDHHIAELAALGIKPPSAAPIFYRVAAARLTAASRIEVSGDGSSGEV
ncbi:MAG: DUF2848 family protein, partial [Methylobacteriaceae bacterium]|nr:DUF2848 family protein [Methylobacteriaceae bacterium]